ncbi:UNVERIFIED_CONTAM: hypothetical protein Sangu_1912000 [Sesamum angustifolium]|uniref:Uncharacterized protein n=1 Tax=Sesamum angustifolium TaxID=2727405 RepID=A0AAW2LVT5_9LAMI
MKYECPRLSLLIITPIPKANVIGPKSYNVYPMLMYTERRLALSTLISSSNSAGGTTRPVKTRSASPAEGTRRPVHTRGGTGRPNPRSNYELFNCNNLNIRYWSWNYRGCCWHQTCPPMDPR